MLFFYLYDCKDFACLYLSLRSFSTPVSITIVYMYKCVILHDGSIYFNDVASSLTCYKSHSEFDRLLLLPWVCEVLL